MSVVKRQAAFLAKADELNIEKTFECGQCFRWKADENGVYSGIARGKRLFVWEEGGSVLCSAAPEDMPFWFDYFDLQTDYSFAAECFSQPEYLKKCAEYGAGIHILRQEPWEALCSFIISQCNNIPRIKGIVDALCRGFGEELEDGYFAFPAPEAIAPLEAQDLAPLRSGYRAEYILNAARAVCDGRLDFDGLKKLPPEEAFLKVTEIHGVGKKVANCFLLYGMHIMDRFPIDVWMARALKNNFPADFDPGRLGSYSGLAQQYIFYYIRTADIVKLASPAVPAAGGEPVAPLRQ